jgi:hypothetical protein
MECFAYKGFSASEGKHDLWLLDNVSEPDTVIRKKVFSPGTALSMPKKIQIF